MGLFKIIGAFFANLFTSMKKLYGKLTLKEQELSVVASSFFALINANIDKTPETVIRLLQIKFPGFTKQQLTAYINDLTNKMRIIDSYSYKTLEENLGLLQNHLKKFSGNGWKAETLNGVNILISLLLPGTPLEKITMVLEYIYQKLVKGNLPK